MAKRLALRAGRLLGLVALLMSVVVAAPPRAEAWQFRADNCRWRGHGNGSPAEIWFTNVDLTTGIDAQYRVVEEAGIKGWNKLVQRHAMFIESPYDTRDFDIDSTYRPDMGPGFWIGVCDNGWFQKGAVLRLNQEHLDEHVHLGIEGYAGAVMYHEAGHAYGLYHEDRFGCAGPSGVGLAPILKSPLCPHPHWKPSPDDVAGVENRYPIETPVTLNCSFNRPTDCAVRPEL